MNTLDDLFHGTRVNVAVVSECVRKDSRQTLAQIAENTYFSKMSFEENPFVVNGLSSGRMTTGIFCMTMHQHIDPNW
ncbi:hypothetical protein TNCV_820231 [Trichonephila clavipes]|nr:hypothetical protein TNCV_820231 [Trichonephila clavipes]